MAHGQRRRMQVLPTSRKGFVAQHFLQVDAQPTEETFRFNVLGTGGIGGSGILYCRA